MYSILKKIICICTLVCLMFSCQERLTKKETLKQDIQSQIDSIDGDIALSFYNLSDSTDILSFNVSEEFHAASTMKVPVMIELFKQANAGNFNLSDSILLINEFKSIVDGSAYSMDIADDSDDAIYKYIDTKVVIKDIMRPMITVSSNLATNVLIELVNAKRVTKTMRDLGADHIEVLRGVEDQKAYDQGLSNSTTANDLMLIMKAIANGSAGTEEACRAMIEILKEQKFNEVIPKYLPKDVSVAHKTGSITGVHHDAGIVYLPDGRSYVLVLLSKNLADFDKGTDQLARLSETVYKFMLKE